MKKTKTRNTDRGIIDPGGIIIDGDIGLSTRLEVANDRLLILRIIISALASICTVKILGTFLHHETFYEIPIILTTLSVAIIAYGKGLFKLIGAGLMFLQVSVFVFSFSHISNGFYIALYRYFHAASGEVSEGITSMFKKIPAVSHNKELTLFFMFFGAMIALLIAVACVVRFDFPILFVSSFPILELGLYHGWDPPTLAVLGLVICWIVVLSISLINHSTNKAGVKNTFAVHKRKRAYYFTSSGLKKRFFTVYISMVSIVCAVVFTTVVLFSSITGFVRPKSFTKLRADITEAIENLSFPQIENLLSRYNGGFDFLRSKQVGGTNGGRLGEKDGISFSGRSALNVKIERIPSYTLYLKGYVAGKYEDNCWDPVDDTFDARLSAMTEDSPIQDINYNLYKEYIYDKTSNTISVSVLEADEQYVYAPYMSYYHELHDKSFKIDTERDDMVLNDLGNDDFKYQLTFWDMSPQGNDWGRRNGIIDNISRRADSNDMLNSLYYSYVNNVYRDVTRSEGLNEAYNGVLKYLNDDYYYSYELQCAEAIRQYFSDNFTYDLNPGATESGWDFIDYFIRVQKKGYCSYFATAGTMLMRMFGFPARYVEGYVISPSQFVTEGSVIEADVTDKTAHAWCEVYLSGIGWVPLEFTPGYNNSSNPNMSFSELHPQKETTTSVTTTTTTTTKSSVSGSTGTSKTGANTGSSGQNNSSGTTTKSIGSGSGSGTGGDQINIWKYEPEEHQMSAFEKIIFFNVGFIILSMAILAFRRVFKVKKQKKLISQEDNNKAVQYIYLYYIKYLALIDISCRKNITDEMLARELIRKCNAKNIQDIDSDILRLTSLAVEAHHSLNEIDKDELFFAKTALDRLKKEIVPERLSIIGKFASKWFYGLY